MFTGFGSDFGVSNTLPAAMLDGNPSTYWSNRYSKLETQTLNAVTAARPEDWVSVTWAPGMHVDSLQASFITDANDELPATATVYYRNGNDWLPVSNRACDLRWRVEHAVDDHVRPRHDNRPETRHDQPRPIRPHHGQAPPLILAQLVAARPTRPTELRPLRRL